ncbi:sensor histidine kinase [Cystobacter fuscus]|uniref:sensor histidine kinase n=1 Tax=Cystobacter fuscus TaxID=43 RepID=UPI000BB2E493|nr:PAS domain-containing sensor histidine kinase [Cystobacter fuscus]
MSAPLASSVPGSHLARDSTSDTSRPPQDERFALLLEHMAEAFLSLDERGRVLRCNTRAAALLGVEAERLRGQEPWTAAPGLMGRTLHERLVAALESRQPARFLASLPPRTWLEVSVVPVGEELWVLATDITQREEAQALVEQTEKRFRLLGERFQVALDSAQMAVWETNLATGQVFRSEGHDRLYGYPEPLPTWTHERFLEALHPEDRPEVEAQVATVFSQDVKAYTSTFRVRGVEGSWRWLTSRARVLRDAEGRPLVVRGAILDITPLKETELALQESVRVREDFLSLAGHELKTPLTGLNLQVQMLRRLGEEDVSTPLRAPRVQARLDAIDRGLRRLGTLGDNLLDVSRIRHGQLDFIFTTGDLSALVSEVVARTEDEARTAGVSLVGFIEPRVVGRFDRLRMEQVLVNLLFNALRHGGGHPVEVVLERYAGGARLVVSDEGPGVPEADRERIFARFEQVQGGARAGGLGLGLFVVRQCVEGHRGRVYVRPGPGGRGAAFVVELPL